MLMHLAGGSHKDPVRNGEMYRMIADTCGAFVQPALAEAFCLAVVEVRHSFSNSSLFSLFLVSFLLYSWFLFLVIFLTTTL